MQIERANKILFDETDKVKALHSKLALSDAMQENDQLIQIKRQIAALKKAQEEAFVEQQKQALEVRLITNITVCPLQAFYILMLLLFL